MNPLKSIVSGGLESKGGNTLFLFFVVGIISHIHYNSDITNLTGVSMEKSIHIPTTVGPAVKLVVGDRDLPWGAVGGEVMELLFDCRSLADVKEEYYDVLWAITAKLYLCGILPAGFPALGQPTLKKFKDRYEFMAKVFAENGVVYSVDYAARGSNWAKPCKVKHCFDAAGITCRDNTYVEIAERFSNSAM